MDTAVDKALIVLDSLERNRHGRPLVDIAKETGLPKPTVHRLLATLERHGYVQQLPSGRYALGMRVVALGQFVASNNTLLSVSEPILDRLVKACGETVHLGILQGESLLYIDRREPEEAAVRLAALPSPLTSLHASASGKVLLAFSSAELTQKVLSGELARYTPHTITDAAQLRDELDAIRAAGYAVNEQERFIGVRAIGMPVRNSRGKIVGAVSAAGPVQRVDPDKLLKLQMYLAEAAKEFATSLI
jgi:DNA-binding IclR family transcriptional regulator